ncbi:xanthine dehydrogenase family protein subunit M [Pseudodesulfovibrio sp.]|uniref:FAD binding domain-containing protein n=1 Tax=Pseudodesulfovibrio sp. TaxID=2035812 RepID=UPI00261F5E71|nr:xanthine dehydrogenase family protein subunit M [Pseudodesulfovibrio sp.]MDD3311442.1 xanthine dehydrogenase family protein subunit M [Pseudodesulfovibrio sp.]
MNVLFPATADAVLEALRAHPDARLMAGGTDLLVRRRAGAVAPGVLVCLERVADLNGVEVLGDAIRIGAATTLTAILENGAIRERLPLLRDAAGAFASPPVRNMATLGGNLCTASPAADTLPPLCVLGAEAEILSSSGTRRMPVADFVTGPGRTALEPGELLGSVTVPVPGGGTIQHFEKVGRRKAMAIAVVSLAALLRVEGGVIAEARLAWGSVGPTVVRCPEAEALLAGRAPTLETFRAAGESVRRAVRPIDDVRASAGYRRRVAANLLLRLAEKAGPAALG